MDGQRTPRQGAGHRACIIGAGISGLTAAKALNDRGVSYDQFELDSALGGLWRIDHPRSAAYESLHINSSKYNMELADFPVPGDVPEFAHHTDVLRYFEAYAEAFDLHDRITFNTAVERAAPNADGTWDVTLDTGETRRYGAVLGATGHHWNPRFPDFSGTFDGRTLHAHAYHDPAAFEGERICIVGIGNSACDIADDLTRVAEQVTISTRSGAWIIPKYLLGVPLDQWTSHAMEYLPLWCRRTMLRLLTWLTVGRQARYGVPTPDHKMMHAHPTVSQELLSHVGHGRVAIKPNIARLDGDVIAFEDDTREAFDTLIYATGYRIAFPFLPDDVFHVENNEVSLYHFVVPPDLPNLYLLGLIQPLGALMPLSELQAKWVAGLLAGEFVLPDPETMRRAIGRTKTRMAQRYQDSPRHTIQCDFWTYRRTLQREMRRGRKRARRLGASWHTEHGEQAAPVISTSW
jgi:cation diffusion facilitator CzcD-associated flavoprotein CzcO